ncbi:MAG TPA: SAM-dependent methyltransferase [Geobacteraceae bacterium]|nr:SAM-dependent methyltransferase [Geobacteraceae bacterium]
MEQSEDRELRNILLNRIRERGRITFAEFMAACLYEPGLGYYTSPGRKVGAEGDFYTSSNVHQVFGRLIAREIHCMWHSMGTPDRFEIVEVGAGSGRLAADVMDTLAEIDPRFFAAVTLRLIEAEPTLKEQQREMLAAHLAKVAWSEPVDLAGGGLAFSGCLYSNELIDSFPVHLVEMTGAGLREVFVTGTGDEFGECLDFPSSPELGEFLQRVGISLVEGQRAEINLAARSWLKSVARAVTRGFVMTIDYGYPAVELYAPHRKNGTLLCYYRHTTEENPYIRVGLQDMTSHVDFTTLINDGEALGLGTVWFGEQYRFLIGAGMLEELMTLEARAATEEERLKHRLALKKLMLPDGGMGDTFRVLIQARGVDNPQLLSMRDWGKCL